MALAPSLADVAQGEGFLSKPPQVGSSVTYRLNLTIFSDDDEETYQREMSISCVGKEATETGNAYWIEIVRPSRSGERVGLYKMLIKEEHFVAGKPPLQDFVRGYMQPDIENDEFEEVDNDGRRSRWLGRFLLPVPSFAELTGEESAEVAIDEVGTFRCAVRKGEEEHDIFGGEATLFHSATLHLTDEIPFGVARAVVSTDIEFGEGGRSTDSEVEVLKFTREGAESQLPQAK